MRKGVSELHYLRSELISHRQELASLTKHGSNHTHQRALPPGHKAQGERACSRRSFASLPQGEGQAQTRTRFASLEGKHAHQRALPSRYKSRGGQARSPTSYASLYKPLGEQARLRSELSRRHLSRRKLELRSSGPGARSLSSNRKRRYPRSFCHSSEYDRK